MEEDSVRKKNELWRNEIATEDQGMMLFSDIFSS